MAGTRRRQKRSGTAHRVIIGIMAVVLVVLLLVLAWPWISMEPKITLLGEPEVTVAQDDEYVDEGASAVWYRQDVSEKLYMTDNVDTSQIGTYEVSYHVDGRWMTFSVTRTVFVTDQTPPEIILTGEDPVIVDSFDEYQEPGAIAMDNCDGDVTDLMTISSPEQIDEETQEVYYYAQDTSGNKASAIRRVELKDEVLPEITLNGDAEISIDRYTEFDDPWVTATDNRDGDISDSVTRTGYVDIYRADTYEVTYTATDSSGNSVSVNRTVEVEDAPCPEDHVICMTFDDGPSYPVTEEILDTLKANDIKATFFIVDYSEAELPLIQRMIDEGHTIGIHAYSHEYGDIYTSADAYVDSVNTLAEKLKNDTGYEAFCLRFPGGSSNTVSRKYCEGVMTELVERVTDEGWMYFDWNVDSTDAEGENVAVETLVSHVEGELDPSQVNVVLCHDTSSYKQTTADALQTIIDYGKGNGYTFEAITPDTVQVHHGLNN